MKKFIRLFAVLAILTGFVVSQLGQLSAQSNALSFTPRKDYTLEPGSSVSDTLVVTNTDDEGALILALRILDFTAEGETGAPQLNRDPNAPKTPWSLRDYITMPEQVTVGPGETVRIPITIEMPSDIGAGSYYSAIEYAATTDPEENRVNISASGITLMFVKVPGVAKQQLTFEQFGAFKPDNNGSGGSFAGLFFNERPKVLAYRLTNEGNIAEQPNASIVVKDSAGKVVYTISDANPKDQIALRGQTRRFDACIAPESVEQTTDNGNTVDTVLCGDTNFKPGRYTAELTVLYGENNTETREITARATFWYLPWWFVGLVFAGIAIIAAAGFYIWRRIQGYRGRKTRRR